MEPIGIRQNNPGNIRYGAGFAGEEEGERGFGRYASPEAGAQALIKNLQAYHRKHGLNTVAGIINRWAPPNENDTSAYVNAVATHLGVAPDTPLGMHDPGTLAKLGTAISKQEGNGRVYTAQFFEALVSGGLMPTGRGDSREEALAAWAASEGLPTFTKQQMRSAAYHANPDAPGEPDMRSVDDRSYIDSVHRTSALYEEAAELQGATEAAAMTRWAGVGEAFAHSWRDTVTGTLIDLFERGKFDANFKIGDAQFSKMAQAGILPMQPLVDFVKDARNQDDFDRRMEIAIERKDYYERASNTQGLASVMNGAAGFLASMADPVAVVASMGMGAAVSSARAAKAVAAARTASRATSDARHAFNTTKVRADTLDALEPLGKATMAEVNAADIATINAGKGVVAASRAEAAAYGAASEARLGSIGYAARSGAAENIVAGEFVRQANNQEFSPGDVLFQGVFGAAMGTLGGILSARAARRERIAEKMADEMAVNLETSLQDLLDGIHAGAHARRPGEDGTVSTAIADIPTERVLSRTDAVETQQARTSTAEADGLPQRRIGYDEVRRTGHDGGQGARFSQGEAGKGDFTPIQHARYQEFKKNGLIEEVRAEDLEGLPGDAKAVYVPKDGKVYVVRERLTPAEAADPTGLIAHEVGVHYGMERLLGSEKYAQVLQEVERLSKTDARVREALAAVPQDTPANLVLEEALGYFAEKNPKLGTLARIMADIRSWLREHVPLFKNMGLSANELSRLVQGSVEAARKPEIRATEGQARFSKTASGQGAAAQRREFRKSKNEQDLHDKAQAWDETVPPEAAAMQRRLRKYYEGVRDKAVADGMKPWLDSPGLILALSKSKAARFIGAQLFESATGLGKRTATAALDYERMQMGYKHMAIPRLKELLVQGMTPQERAYHMFGGAKAAEDRVWRAVEAERQQHRNAVRAKVPYESTAPDYIQAAAKVMDDFYEKVVQDGLVAGNPLAGAVKAGGTVGHIPYEWQWERISKARLEDLPRFNAFFDNLTQQYHETIVDPALEAMFDAGPVHPEHAAAMRERLREKVAAVVDTKIRTIMSDSQSRVDGMAERMEITAADLLDENFAGETVTPELIQSFRDKFGEVLKDRRRTELDLVREVNGVALLDFIKYNAIDQITHGAHRWAGLNALARKGFTDKADIETAVTVAAHDGATPQEQEAIRYAFHALGLGQARNAERAAWGTVRNFTYAAMMGKLGFANFADAANVVSAIGIRGMLQVIGTGFAKNSEFMKQLAIDAPGLLGQDYRLASLTPDVSATGRMMVGEGSTLNRVSQRAAQGVSYISGANHVQSILHKAFLPIFAENVLRAIRGEHGGMTLERMVDLGLDREAMRRIKTQLEKYDAGRQRGGRINWDKWDDQGAADDLINALHRGTYQVFQRAMVGEQPMWMTETTMGAFIGQFRRFGMIAAEKQAMRNIALGDANAATTFVMGATWGALLYYARLQASTLGMSDEDREKFLENNTKGFRLATGIFNHMNASGILPEFSTLGETFFGGSSIRQPGSPIAAMGFFTNLAAAGNQIGSYFTGQSKDSEQLTRSLFHIAPGGNSILGSYLMHEMTSE